MGICFSAKQKEKGYIASQANVANLKNTYEIDMKVLGSGSFGKVFLAKNKKDHTMQIAIKVIKKSNLTEDDL